MFINCETYEKNARIISLLTSIVLTSWCLNFFYFVKATSNVSNYNRNMTEAIVVFGTNDQELYAGTQLLKLGYAPLVFVTSDKPKNEFFSFFTKNSSSKGLFCTKLMS